MTAMANGLVVFQSLTTVAVLVAIAAGSKIVVEHTPDYVTKGLTKTFTLRCSLQDTGRFNAVVGKRDVTETLEDVLTVTSITVVRNSNVEPVAKLTNQLSAAVPLTDLNSLKVHGDLGRSRPPSANAERAFLEMQWKWPSKNQTGGYTCSIVAADSQGQPVIYSTSVEISEEAPSTEDMLEHLGQLERTVDALEERLATVENTTGLLKPPHAEEGLVECKDSDSWKLDPYQNGGRYEVHTVKFQTPYEQVPMVSLGIDLLDESSDAYLRVHTDIENLTKEGFTLRCGTWADTYIFTVRVRWVSVVA